MLMPAKVKWRKQQKGNMKGTAYRGSTLAFGDIGLQATECGRINGKQIEAARVAINRHIKRGGKLWVRVFPHKPITQKPAETRMGHGKGGVEYWAFIAKPGHILYEMEGVPLEIAKEAFRLAAHKLPVSTKLVRRGVS